jgi:arylsulfatase A-like enzyme
MARNVVLVVLDSVRKDYFDEHAPQLAAAADVAFDQCRATSNWSPESHGAVVTGELPHVSGIHGEDPSYDDTPVEETFFDAFRDHYRWAVSSNVFVSRTYGFDRYFDAFTNVSRHAVFGEGEEIDDFLREVDTDSRRRYWEFLKRAVAHDHTTKSVCNGVSLKVNDVLDGVGVPRLWDYGTRTQLGYARRLVESGPEPFFGFINLMETHNPHANNVFYDGDGVPDSWGSDQFRTVPYNNMLQSDEATPDDDHVRHYRELYAGSIRYVDERVLAFVDSIRAATDAETTVVVTADHGENLCYPDDDGLLGHIGNMSESLLHVPLVVFNAPESVREPDDKYVSHLDLGTLLAGLANDELAVTFRDRPAAEVVAAAPPEDAEQYDYWDRMIRAVHDDDRKYVWDSFGERTVYELACDRPCRQTEVDDPWDESVGESFEADIESVKGRFTAGKEWADGAATERLQKLGYL